MNNNIANLHQARGDEEIVSQLEKNVNKVVFLALRSERGLNLGYIVLHCVDLYLS